MKNPFSNERPDQIVAGPRRPPALNAGGNGFGASPVSSEAQLPSRSPSLEPVPSASVAASPATHTSEHAEAASSGPHVRKRLPGNPASAAASSTNGTADATFVSQMPKSAEHTGNTPVDTNLVPQLKSSKDASSPKEASAPDDNTLPPFSLSSKPVEGESNAVSVDKKDESPHPLKDAPSPKEASASNDNTLPPFSLSSKPAKSAKHTKHSSKIVSENNNEASQPLKEASSRKETRAADDNVLMPVTSASKPVEHVSSDAVGTNELPQLKPLNAVPVHKEVSKEASIGDDNTLSPVSPSPKPVEHVSTLAPVNSEVVPLQEPLKVISSHKEKAARNDDTLPPWKRRNPYVLSDENHDNDTAPVALEDNKNTERTPALSSVPPNPAVFNDIKQDRKPQVEELQSEQTKAQEDKAALMAEPSQKQNVAESSQQRSTAEPSQQQGKVAREIVPLAEKSAPPLDTPIAIPVDSVAVAPGVSQGAPQGTPKRGIDIMTQAEWEALQKARQQAPAAQTSPAVPATAPAN